jgi:hypothetical protein
MHSGNLLRCGLIVMRLFVLGCDGNLLGHGPHAPHQLTSHGHHDLVGVCPTGAQCAVPFTEPDLGLPAASLDRFGVFFESELERPAHLRWVPLRPGAFNEGATGLAMPGFGHGTLAAARATGVCRGNEAQKCHAFSGGIEARQVSALGPGGYGHRALDAAQGLEGFDHWLETPGCAPLLELLCETLEAFRVFGHGADLCLKDDWLRRGRAPHLREPPERGRVPGGPARVPSVVPEQKGFETALGIFEITEGIFACPGAVAHGFIFHLGDRDRGEIPRARQAGQWHGVPAVRCDAVTGLCGNQRGGHDPAIRAFFRPRALEPVATRTGFVDEEQMCGL